MEKIEYIAMYAWNSLAVFEEDKEDRLENALPYLAKPKFKTFKSKEKAMRFAINGYNSYHEEPWKLYLDSKLPLNWVIYQKEIEKRYYASRKS